MPRKNPIGDIEIEIGRRLAQHRKSHRCPRSYLGARVGLDSAAIARIELGRVPLKYYQARSLLSFLNLNPVWVATGAGDPSPYFDMPDAASLGCEDSDPFSWVYGLMLKKAESNQAKVGSESQSVAASLLDTAVPLVQDWAKNWIRTISPANLQEFLGALKTIGDFMASNYAEKDPVKLLERNVAFAENKKKMFTDVPTSGMLPSVKSRLDSLLAELNRLTKERGMKTNLADYLGVPLASVSRWLSGDIEPGGETTLRMLQWVKEHGRK
jgi:transcriptional regulator with XRE-family HTH domain